jgi:hypothetical protein
MKGVRGKGLSAYDTAKTQVEAAIDDSNISTIQAYGLGILEDGNKANITIYKKQHVTNSPSLYLDYFDGIETLTYKERAPHTQVNAKSTEFQGSFTRGNFSTGPISKVITGKYTSNAHAQRMAFLESEKDSEDLYELTVGATKGYHTSVDSIVSIETGDTNISGSYRLVSKKISYKKMGKMGLTLSFNKEPIRVSDYLG